MLSALLSAFRDLGSPRLHRLVAIGFLIALAIFVLLWLAAGALLTEVAVSHSPLFDSVLALLGGFAVSVLSWLLFPAIVGMSMGFVLDPVAAAVEELDYPGRGRPRAAPLGEILSVMLWWSGLAIFFNLLALPLYLVFPGMNLLLFLLLNGYVFGRQYFEAVALRRLDWASVRRMRSRLRGRVFMGGVAIAGLFLLPLINLFAPVIATAFMVHVFEGLRGPESELARP